MTKKRYIAIAVATIVLLAMTATFVTAGDREKNGKGGKDGAVEAATIVQGVPAYWIGSNDYSNQQIKNCSNGYQPVTGMTVVTPYLSYPSKMQIIFSSETTVDANALMNVHATVDGAKATGPEYFARNNNYETRTGQYIALNVPAGTHTVQISACTSTGVGYLYWKDMSVLVTT